MKIYDTIPDPYHRIYWLWYEHSSKYLDRAEQQEQESSSSSSDNDDSMTPFLIFAPTYRHLEQLYESLACVNGKKKPV
jgi:hypothetical protein